MSENRLGRETSPYLLQHRDNPVHWWAWGPEALAEARATGKPILLSVGYAACHWCHVMAHESFEDGETAAVMNAHFVNIKVDREERPDIDAIYMGALHQLGQQGGWPLTMFLDADARPFWGGTYFPKRAQWGRPGFVDVLQQVARIYREEPDKVAHNAVAIVNALSERTPSSLTFDLSDDALRRLIARMIELVDPQSGGIRGAPKFPQWSFFWLLWRGAMRLGDAAAREAVTVTLKNICQGGIYDHLGGGFARYSVDADWLVPHFEKMLYDNALLIDLLTELWRETQEPLFAARIAETIAWLEREMVTKGGGLAASLDADSEGEEGKFYVWRADEIAEVLGDEDAALFALVYGVTPEGNFEGHTILNRLGRLDLLNPAEEARLASMRQKLLERRGARVRPGFDDKVLADWNGLAIGAIARAGAVFDRQDWIGLASRAFAFVEGSMCGIDGRLRHSARDGRLSAPATASDYANMIWGALRLYQATGEPGTVETAIAWARDLDSHYWDEEHGGYFTAAIDTTDVIVRLKSVQDDATPAANAVHLGNLMSLAAITGDAAYIDRAEALFEAFSSDVARSPAGHAAFVAAALDRSRLTQIVVTGHGNSGASALRQVVACTSNPGALEFLSLANAPDWLPSGPGKKSKNNYEAEAYVCVGPVCGLPCRNPDELKTQLVSAREFDLSVTGFTALKGLTD